VILADTSYVSSNADAATFLKNAQIPVRYLASPVIHVKSMIVDGTSAYLGSENFSYTSLDKNREVGLITNQADVIGTMKGTFEGDWSNATAF